MRLVRDRVQVQVPATSANLGPGYDCLGLALSLHDRVSVYATTGKTEIIVEGEGAQSVSLGEDNLVVSSLRQGLELVGAPQVGLRMHCVNAIPHGRGLGSSASAIVCGLMLARGLLAQPEALSQQRILDIATQAEGHPDNVAPAIFGGATVAWSDDLGVHSVGLEVHQRVHPTVFIPDFELPTAKARQMLPQMIPHADGVFNATRTALLVSQLASNGPYLLAATQDCFHQDYREAAMESSLALMRWLRDQELPAVISGAGPTVLVLGPVPAPVKVQARASGWDARSLQVDRVGAQIVSGR